MLWKIIAWPLVSPLIFTLKGKILGLEEREEKKSADRDEVKDLNESKDASCHYSLFHLAIQIHEDNTDDYQAGAVINVTFGMCIVLFLSLIPIIQGVN